MEPNISRLIYNSTGEMIATIIYQTFEMKGGGMYRSLYFHCSTECDLVEWAIATHGMYESLLEMYYFWFQVINGLYMSYKKH